MRLVHYGIQMYVYRRMYKNAIAERYDSFTLEKYIFFLYRSKGQQLLNATFDLLSILKHTVNNFQLNSKKDLICASILIIRRDSQTSCY